MVHIRRRSVFAENPRLGWSIMSIIEGRKTDGARCTFQDVPKMGTIVVTNAITGGNEVRAMPSFHTQGNVVLLFFEKKTLFFLIAIEFEVTRSDLRWGRVKWSGKKERGESPIS